MAYIYKITNQINDKVYIGKTLKTVEERWKEHSKDYKRREYEKRPLYSAINKYGIENFSIEQIEECSHEVVNEREKYWIEKYGSFKYGYNATLGGDGKAYADYDLIFSLWKEGKNISEIHSILGYDIQTIRTALNEKDVTENERQARDREKVQHQVAMLDIKTSEILQVFPSIQAAYNLLNKQHSGHISEACKGKRKSAYGYKWKYLE